MSELTKAIAKPVGIAIGVLLVGGVVWWLFLRGKDNFDPTSDQNLAYRGVNAVGAALTGDEGFSLGTWLFDTLDKRAQLEKAGLYDRVALAKLAAKRAPPDERAWYEQLFTRGG